MVIFIVCLLIGLGVYALATPPLLACLCSLACYMLWAYRLVAFSLTRLHFLGVFVRHTNDALDII